MALKPEVIRKLESYYHIVLLDIEETGTEELDSRKYYFRQNARGEVTELFLDTKGMKSLVYLKELSSLTHLSLRMNRLDVLPETFAYLKKLTHLDLRDNRLEDISALRTLKTLRSVQLEKNRLKDISPLYAQLKSGVLEKLSSEGNRLQFPDAGNKEWSEGDILYWFDYRLHEAREKIEACRRDRLEVLDLGRCGLTDLSLLPELFKCTHLKALILSNEWAEFYQGEWILQKSLNKGELNNFFHIPESIYKLKNLETLICGGDWNTKQAGKWNRWRLRSFSPFKPLQKLRVLNLSNNKIRQVGQMDNLMSLERLHLNNNFIDWVSNHAEVPNLKELYLSNNFISSLQFLKYFPAIETLDLHSNWISDLSSIKYIIEKLDVANTKWQHHVINLAKNNLSKPPMSVVAEGKAAVLAHFEQAEAEAKVNLPSFINRDIKLILLGNSNAGKSTFLKWLKEKTFVVDIATTHWLEREKVIVKYKGRDYFIRVFDFGGQEYYHDTHHLFFTNQSGYVLLWDRDGNNFSEIEVDQLQQNGSREKVIIKNYPLAYWLDSVQYHSMRKNVSLEEGQVAKIVEQKNILASLLQKEESLTNSSAEAEQLERNILVLQNKVDLPGQIEAIDEVALRNKHPKIFEFFRMSVKNKRGVEHAEHLVFELIQSIKILDQEFLGTWGAIKQSLENNLLSYPEECSFEAFKTLCNGIIRTIPEVQNARIAQLRAVNFNDADTHSFAQYLSDIGMILYFPEDANLSDRVFINPDAVLQKINKVLLGLQPKNGKFDQHHVAQKLAQPNFNESCRTLIEIMLHFKIIINHPVNPDTYIAPLYLPAEPTKSIKLFLGAFGNPVYKFIFSGFIHKGIVLQFFSRYGNRVLKDTEGEGLYYYWRDGIILKDEVSHEIVLVKFNGEGINMQQPCIELYGLGAAAQTSSKLLNEIADEIEKLTLGMGVSKAVSANGKDFVPLVVLQESLDKALWVFPYENKTFKLSNFKKYLPRNNNMKNIFISYSKDDLALVNTFIKHLATLRQDGKIANWYCTELTAGREWDEEIRQHFDDSDIICFMVSPNFMKTQYIMDNEVKWAFERRASDKNYRIVPIILDFCRWTTEKNNLGTFTALPYTAKPILDFKNANMAWYITIECIRIMIEKDLDPIGSDNFYSGYLPKDAQRIYERIVEGSVDA